MLYDHTFHVTLDSNAHIMRFGGYAESISGYSASDVIGKNWFEIFIPNSNMQEMLTVFASCFNGDLSFWEYENTITCIDGIQHHIKWKNVLLRDSTNNPIAISSQGTVVN